MPADLPEQGPLAPGSLGRDRPRGRRERVVSGDERRYPGVPAAGTPIRGFSNARRVQKTVETGETGFCRIEEFHKSLKSEKPKVFASNAAFAKSPTKRVRTQSNHFFASLVAFTKMEVLRVCTRLNHFAVKAKLYQAALVAALQRLSEMNTGDVLAHIAP